MLVVAEALRHQSFGKYDLIVSLGRGGMANVYLAMAAGLGRFNKLLVLKVLRTDAATDMEDAVSMFLDEARLSARLVHPNIVQTYEVGECEGRYFLAMEYLDGQSYRALQQRARAAEALPLQEQLRILSETARGLHYAHQLCGYDGEPLNVVHRDVSPQNVFVTYDGQVKLLDFGIAKTADAEHMTQVGMIKGKLEYIAPEQMHGDTIDCRADVFSLGVMLWEAVTGKRFAGGPKVAEVTKVHARITGGEPNVRAARPDVPEALAVIVDRATALRPEERWPDAASFADAIDGYLESTRQKPSAKSLSRVIAPLFAEERRKTEKLIEQQIEKVKLRGPGSFGESTGTLPRLRLNDDSTSGLYLGSADAASSAADETPGITTPHASAAKANKLRTWALFVGGAAAIVASAALLLRDRAVGSTQSPSTAPTAEAVASEPAASEPKEPTNVVPGASAAGTARSPLLLTLEVEVTPSDARVTLDGAPLAVPFSGKFRKDASLHHLEVSAEGYRAKKQLVAFDQDRTLSVVLQRVRERAVAPAGRRVRAEDKVAPGPVETPAPETAEAPAAAPAPAAPEPGADLKKSVKPRISRGHIDAIDPYSVGN